MEPTKGKPPKKRRRWLIGAFVLVLVSVCSWWYWPRGDARFVGSWVLVNTIGASEGAYRFRSDGIAERYAESNDSTPILMSTYRWSVDGSELRLRPAGKTWLFGTVISMAGLGAVPTRSFQIIRLDGQLIEVVDTGLQRTMSFERVHDFE